MQWFSWRRFACLSLTLVMVCLAYSDARAEPLPLKIGVVYSYTGAPEYEYTTPIFKGGGTAKAAVDARHTAASTSDK